MPAEWEPHTATWLSWPRRHGISFPGRYNEVMPTLAEMVRVLAQHETVHINIRPSMVADLRALLRAHGIKNNLISSPIQRFNGSTIQLHFTPTNEPWCRDHGPIFVKRKGFNAQRSTNLAVVDWGYNAWGGKYPPFDKDDAVPQHIARLLNLPLFQPGIVMEGGSIDVNGRGSLLTSEQCLLNKNRNPHLKKSLIEKYLRDYLGVTNLLWLGDGIVGDDTDGHVDDIARFVNLRTVVAAVEEDPRDENYKILQDNLKRLKKMKDQDGRALRIVEIPMPGTVEYDGQRLPASYANFYIANKVVLLPTYQHKRNDRRAKEILQRCFPARRIVPMDSTNLIWGLGSFHCLTQQQPA